MLRRPLAALATALSAAALVAVPAAGPATAAGTCTLTPPARIAIYADFTERAAAISGDCVPDGAAVWFTPGEDDENDEPRYAFAGYFAEAEEDGGSFLGVPDRLDVYGRQKWEAFGAINDVNCDEEFRQSNRQGAKDGRRTKSTLTVSPAARARAACQELDQNEPYSDIRLGGYASLTGVRHGSRITFTAGSGGWSPFSHKLVARPNLGGEIQTQYADGSWHRVGNPFRTGSNAKATLTVTIPAARTFRYAIYSTPSYFERATAPITR